MSTAALLREASDDELVAEDRRLARLPRPSARGILTVPKALAHERLQSAREALPGAATAAFVTAARGAAKADGPYLEDLRRAHDLHQLATAPESYWQALAAVVDGPTPAGMGDAFSDDDPAAEIRAKARALEARRDAIAREQEARRVVAQVVARPGLSERIAALAGKRK